MTRANRGLPRIHFITNGVFSTSIAGGDIHFLKLAEAAAAAGFVLNFFGGTALQEVVRAHGIQGTVTLTDQTRMAKVNQGRLTGQWALFRDFLGRYRQTMRLSSLVGPDDLVYAVSDYWFDVLPAVRFSARRKLMVLHMEAPRFNQILKRSRPDVDPARLASLHYWASQEWSLRRFCRCPRKHVLYLHPAMQGRLRRLGLSDQEMTYVSYGLDVRTTEAVPEQERVYDVVWIGRVHRQKGIDDLLAALSILSKRIPHFRAILIGNVRAGLELAVKELGVDQAVTFSGFVSEEEKIRLFKASRLFLMPSQHEGSPRVIGESIICGTPVVAYDIPNYRPVFGPYVRYVPPFDLEAFQSAAEAEILSMRSGTNYLSEMDLESFRKENSWKTTQAKFLAALISMQGDDAPG